VDHELKTWPCFFEPVLKGKKRFELRWNDRDFHEGDTLTLREWAPFSTPHYTGRRLRARVVLIIHAGTLPSGLEPGHCVMSIELIQ